MAAHSSVLAWRIPGTEEPGGLPSMGSHRVGHDWGDLAAAAAAASAALSALPVLSCLSFPIALCPLCYYYFNLTDINSRRANLIFPVS